MTPEEKRKLSSTTMRIDIPPELEEESPVSRKKVIKIQQPEKASEAPRSIIKIQRGRSDDTRYNALLECNYDAVLITDLSGEISDANTRALSILGYDKNELCKLNITSIISGAGNELVPLVLENLKNERFTIIDAYCARKDGFGIPAEIAVNKIFISAEGELCFFIRDITKRRQVEEELRRANKMKSLHMLAGGVAHDFNNLLTSVIGHIELAMTNITGRSKIKDDLTTALSDASKMAELSRRMLAFSGHGILQKSKVDLNALIKGAIAEVSDIAPANVELNTIPAAAEICVGGEMQILQSMVENILTNGIESVGNMNGSVSVSASIDNVDEDFIEYYSLEKDLKPGRYACISISDTGYGMDNVIAEKVFDPFFSTKGAGRGLGLSEAQGVVLAHGGAIAIESKIGRGSTFYVLLPLYKEAAEAGLSNIASPVSTDISKTTVLVADDEPSIRRYTERVLKRQGMTIYMAEDGEQAVNQFRAHADEIDLVLLDMFMPKLNGDQALKKIREIRPNVKILVVSGYTESVYSDRFSPNDQPTGYLFKPFATEDFLNRIQETLQIDK